MNTSAVILTAALLTCCYCMGPMPTFIIRCNIQLPSFNNCLSNAIQHAIIQMVVPIPDYDLPVIDPFKVPSPAVYGDARTGLRQNYTNMEIFGLTNINSTSATFNPASGVLSINITYNAVLFTFDYGIYGRFITIPMNTISRNSSILLVNPTFELTFNLQEVPRNGTVYFRAVNSTLYMVPQQTIFNYTKVFDDQWQNDALNAKINQNGNDALNYLLELFPHFYTQYFIVWFNNILRRVPAQNFFD
ncbi:uncharacterized protein LOC135139139 [Zophobas morio]